MLVRVSGIQIEKHIGQRGAIRLFRFGLVHDRALARARGIAGF